MGRRIFFGRDGGTIKLRVSGLSTIDAKTEANLTKLTFHELMRPMIPKEKGSVVFTGSGSISVTLNKTYSGLPFIVIKASDGSLPAYGSIWVRYRNNSQSLLITNQTGRAITVNWYLYGEFDYN